MCGIINVDASLSIDIGEECKIRANNNAFINLAEELAKIGEVIAVDFLTINQHLVRIGSLEYLIDFSNETMQEV